MRQLTAMVGIGHRSDSREARRVDNRARHAGRPRRQSGSHASCRSSGLRGWPARSPDRPSLSGTFLRLGGPMSSHRSISIGTMRGGGRHRGLRDLLSRTGSKKRAPNGTERRKKPPGAHDLEARYSEMLARGPETGNGRRRQESCSSRQAQGIEADQAVVSPDSKPSLNTPLPRRMPSWKPVAVWLSTSMTISADGSTKISPTLHITPSVSA